ncbi:MAG: hypothetical protein AB8G23_22530 [Myxococcota bacterium]
MHQRVIEQSTIPASGGGERGCCRRPIPQRAARSLFIWGLGACFVLGAGRAQASDIPSAAGLEGESWEELAPMLMQIVNLSALDPGFAAGMVPGTWVAAAVDGALRVEAEKPESPASLSERGAAPAQVWPVGPWSSSAALAASIQAVQPGAVVGLYRALRPRLEAECRLRKVMAEDCERAIKVTASRLSASSVAAHSAKPEVLPPTPLTPTQKSVAQLGQPAAEALRKGIRAVGTTLWGPPKRHPQSQPQPQPRPQP